VYRISIEQTTRAIQLSEIADYRAVLGATKLFSQKSDLFPQAFCGPHRMR
jgi:hypothetical protein